MTNLKTSILKELLEIAAGNSELAKDAVAQIQTILPALTQEYLTRDGKNCPACGGANVTAASEGNSKSLRGMKCNNCGTEWDEIYRLVGINLRGPGGECVQGNELHIVLITNPDEEDDWHFNCHAETLLVISPGHSLEVGRTSEFDVYSGTDRANAVKIVHPFVSKWQAEAQRLGLVPHMDEQILLLMTM